MLENNTNNHPAHIGFLLLPNYTMITFTSAVAVLRAANRQGESEYYKWSAITLDGKPVLSSDGLKLEPDGSIDLADDVDILFVCGGYNVEQECDKPLLDALRRCANRTPLGAFCTGSYALAAAGLLDDHRCTIHWENEHSLREQFPNVTVLSKVFVIDGDRLTCAGGISSIDLMLNLVAKAQGKELVQEITDQFTYERVRTEDDTQRVPLSYLLGTSQPKLASSIALMEANIEEPLGLDEVAEYAGVSRRQLERLFHKHLNCAPSRYYMELRLRRARSLLLQTNMAIIDIAISCGFSTAPHFSKCYSENYGHPPRDERKGAP
ncbi:GlxA family transcriptional regulator [Porticoccus sp. W117]|uniref:GlxA family transcriptional regulator n=1 Tax=Porticoccus sp. W117 TaxID=3054777 RepID=UPI0025959853|nr:GlxA family transcriptional regulator [Porticoccus sp. W117]MDM3871387.1 GlxA family transcriptional regulator [Porticoccus sp. W117]